MTKKYTAIYDGSLLQEEWAKIKSLFQLKIAFKFFLCKTEGLAKSDVLL